MRYTQTLIPTLKEDPAEAEAISHKLMLRAGLIRKLSSGFYSYLPLGLKSLQKAENIQCTAPQAPYSPAQVAPEICIPPASLFYLYGLSRHYCKQSNFSRGVSQIKKIA